MLRSVNRSGWTNEDVSLRQVRNDSNIEAGSKVSAIASPKTSFARKIHSESSTQAMRRKVTVILQKRLLMTGGTLAKKDDIQKAAESLERKLFQSSTSFEAYSNLSTLDERIRILITIQLQRRMNKSNRRDRIQTLTTIMGAEMYSRIEELVKEIKLIKNQKVATMKCSGDSCSASFVKDGNFPEPVRNIFFNTGLLDAFERSPLDKAAQVNWDTLLATASQNMKAYLEWEKTNSSKTVARITKE